MNSRNPIAGVLQERCGWFRAAPEFRLETVMKSRIQPEKPKEVEQGFQKSRDEPPAISNGRWQTRRDATEI
jgi:hypothetical protein